MTTDLPSCPVCDYDLRGLPAPHRCPECGFRYERETRVWQPQGSLPVSGATVMLVALLIGGWAVTVAQSVLSAWHMYRAVLAGMVLVPIAAYIVGRLLRWRQRPFVAVGFLGLVVRTTGGQLRTVEWRDIRGVHAHPVGRRRFVRLQLHGRRLPLDLSAMVGRQGREFTMLVRDRLANAIADHTYCSPPSM